MPDTDVERSQRAELQNPPLGQEELPGSQRCHRPKDRWLVPIIPATGMLRHPAWRRRRSLLSCPFHLTQTRSHSEMHSKDHLM